MSLARTTAIFLLAGSTALAATALPPEQAEFFEKRIRPVLASECYECHDAKKQKGGLRLDYRDGWKKGGDSGDVIVPGHPEKSLLLKSIRHEDPDLKMPEKRPKLSDAAIADVEKWIALGAPDPRDEPPKAETAVPWEKLLADRKTWWSLQPIRKPEPPAVKDAAWSAHPVDRFLLAKMEERGLKPAADADPRVILRRLTFALTGLPPTPEEVEEFVREFSGAAAEDKGTRGQGDKGTNGSLPLSPPPLVSPSSSHREKAIGRAADRLLASPRFGERWARHWMDLVRYAETHGSEGDPEIPEAWRYRDYLIRAINADVPVDRLIREHIAGDLLPDPRWNRDEQFNESILGIAHLRLVEHGFQPVDTRDEQVKVTDSQIDVAMKAFQGLTVSCARCHDHKFDAISQRDYYALAGIFESSRPAMVTIDPPELLAKNITELAALKKEIQASLSDAWKDEPKRIAARLIAEDEPDPRAVAAAEKVNAFERQIAALDQIARERIGKTQGTKAVFTASGPIARWSFNGDARDSAGALNGELLGGAKIQNGRLVLNGTDACLRSPPLARDLREKTLEAWVSLANLDQRGGGVITVEDAKGGVFDSVVFAEKEAQHWVAGSNNFKRSQNSGGPAETAKPGELVHVAATYRADGTIAVFRNGEPYGQPWKSATESPITFAAGDAHILLGKRHTPGGRAFLSGEIEEARLYDRALDPADLLASFRAGPDANAIDAAELTKALTPEERARRDSLVRELAAARDAHRALTRGSQEKEWRVVLTDAERNPANPFHVWSKLHRLGRDELQKAWVASGPDAPAQSLPAQQEPTGGKSPPHSGQPANEKQPERWNLATNAGDFSRCFHYGTGIGDKPGPCGDFSIAASGNLALTGLMPAGVATNRLSAKHNGVLTTDTFRVETDSISVKAWGGGGAQCRLIVDGYPLGTNPIFPRAQLAKDEPGWLRLDTKYRKGSWAYLEFATTADQTRRDKNAKEVSWFGVSEIVCHDGEPPRDRESATAPLLKGAAPQSAKELALRYEEAIGGALAAWHADSLDESQRLLLDFLIRRELLPVSLTRLGAVKPLVEEYRRLEAEIPAARHSPGVLESVALDAALLPRGDHLKPGAPVPRAFLGVFGAPAFHTKQSGRLELALAMTAPQNPLTARVMANRIWLHLFARGIVATPDNFGRMGEKSVHPELLDYLAARFAEENWSLKKMIRFLVTTRAFGLSADASPEARERDASNDLLSHARIQRLEAEAIRDALLSVSDRMDFEMSGPGLPNGGGGPKLRRSVYLTIRRTALNPFLEVFDAPKPFTTTGRRDATNVPAQSLTLLNDNFVIDCARFWADRLIKENADATPEDRIRRMFVIAFAREPAAREIAASLKYLETAAPGDSPLQNAPAWRDFAQSLFNAKEFIFLR
jgi:cytochrome c553